MSIGVNSCTSGISPRPKSAGRAKPFSGAILICVGRRLNEDMKVSRERHRAQLAPEICHGLIEAALTAHLA